MPTFAEQVIRRIRDEMDRKGLSQQEVCDLLGWSQSRVSQKLSLRTPTTLEELEGLCFAVGLSKVEAVRDHGLEFAAELTPSEMRILERLRQLPRPVWDAVVTLLRINETTEKVERGATKKRPIFGKPRNRPSLSE